MAQRGFLFDGRIALEREVELRADGSTLLLAEADGEHWPVDPADLVRLEANAGSRKFGHRSIDGWRLSLPEPIDPALLELLPSRTGSLIPVWGRRTMASLVTLTVAATAVAALVIFAPELLARHMPMAWERKLGAAYELPIEAAACDAPAGQDALNALIDRVDPQARSDGFTLELVDVDVPNAVALPGGRMVIFDGLFDITGNPDAVAGIVAHEIAHVRRRHVASAMVRELGLGTVITALGGGAIASNAGGLLSLSFSREAETEADADAIAMLRHARIDPRPTAETFQEFRSAEIDMPEWLGSHPASGDRSERFARSADPAIDYQPTLSEDQADALFSACDHN